MKQQIQHDSKLKMIIQIIFLFITISNGKNYCPNGDFEQNTMFATDNLRGCKRTNEKFIAKMMIQINKYHIIKYHPILFQDYDTIYQLG